MQKNNKNSLITSKSHEKTDYTYTHTHKANPEVDNSQNSNNVSAFYWVPFIDSDSIFVFQI